MYTKVELIKSCVNNATIRIIIFKKPESIIIIYVFIQKNYLLPSALITLIH